MGRTTSSTKRKYSKKKSSKISSQARRSKKSNRNKSKKLVRLDDSSSYSDEESTSSMSVFSSSSKDDYSSRKARSHKRSNVKSSKKRASRRTSSSPERSKAALRVKKKRGSKRKHRDSEVTKKRKYKKSRRDANISSSSSDSRSCSTCSSSSGESEFERVRGRSREKKKDKGDSGKARSATKKRKNRSPSLSSCSRFSDASGNDSKEKVAGEVNSRRLRSVITVVKQAEEKDMNESEKDVHTEEIVYDHDDYPSRSNDSTDGANKRELVHQSSDESEKRRRVENVLGQEAMDSELATNEFTVSITDKKEKENGVSVTVVDGSGGEDLESILRQKALENLKRFRGRGQPNAKPHADEEKKSDINVKQLSNAEAEFVQRQDKPVSIGTAQSVGQNRRPKLNRDSLFSTQADAKILDRKESLPTWADVKILNRKESLPTTADVKMLDRNESLPRRVDEKILEGKESLHPRAERKIPDGRYRGIEPGSSQSESSLSKLRQESLGTGSSLKPAPTSLKSPKASLVLTESTVNEGVGETSQTSGDTSSNRHGVGVTEASGSTATEPASSVKPSSEEDNSREGQGHAKDSSQFEQKTMSVMRGGEMVQVSYKVYIPKKAPALARRQLQR
ncbi:hypothetical protein LguiB_002884 [Lonicera macranthoides]